jgi:hypothetical protein
VPRVLKLALIIGLYAASVTVLGLGLTDWLADWNASLSSEGRARAETLRRGGLWLSALPIAAYAAVAALVSRRGLPLTVSRYAAAVLLGALLTPVLLLLATVGAIGLYGLWAMPPRLWSIVFFTSMTLPGGAAALFLRVRQRAYGAGSA